MDKAETTTICTRWAGADFPVSESEFVEIESPSLFQQQQSADFQALHLLLTRLKLKKPNVALHRLR
jgi:hypothetical protein